MAKIKYWFGRGSAKNLAFNFGGQQSFGGELDTKSSFKKKFKHMWELTSRADEYSKINHDDMEEEVEQYLDELPFFVNQAEQDLSGTGTFDFRQVRNLEHLSTYRTASQAGRAVVFSDIHITDTANRQNFFEWANKDLYLQVLSRYYGPRNYTLIENGDVEELLIFEPVVEGSNAMPDFRESKNAWSVITDDRETRKFSQFELIVSQHEDYYRVINDHFLSRDAYFRTIGNHDYDLAKQDFVDVVEATLGFNFPVATDAVLLTSQTNVSYFICHGHQFDSSCTPRHAPFAGESFSQGSAWAYQGPDRYWTIDKDGDGYISQWLNGSKPYDNMLVSALPDESNLSQTDAAIIKTINDLGAIPLAAITGAVTAAIISGPVGWVAAIVALAAKPAFKKAMKKQKTWEALYTKNIAWEYFDNESNALECFKAEIKEGERWYKFRHMDEVKIVNKLDSFFGPNGVKLLLGHSHEPRINSAKIIGVGPAPPLSTNYLNSAAAGRFENLIWGIEILNGEPKVISWHQDEDDALIKTNWKDEIRSSFLGGIEISKSYLVPESIIRLEAQDDSSSQNSSAVSAAVNNMMLR